MHDGFAFLYGRLGRHREGLGHARQALALYRATGNRRGEATSLNNIGWAYANLGDHHQAVDRARQALAVLSGAGRAATTEANTWDTLAFAYWHLRRYDEAAAGYRRAVDIFIELGDKYQAARSRHDLGNVYRDAGDHSPARDAWEMALRVFDELGHPDAEAVRKKLADLSGG